MASCPHTQVAVSGLLRRPCLAQGDSVGASTWTPTTRTHTLHTHVHIHTTHMYTVHMYTYHVHIHTTHKYMPQHVHSIHTMYTHVHTMRTSHTCTHHTHIHTTSHTPHTGCSRSSFLHLPTLCRCSEPVPAAPEARTVFSGLFVSRGSAWAVLNDRLLRSRREDSVQDGGLFP